MYEKVFLVQYENRFLGYACARRSIVFAFKHHRHVEYVKKHIRYDMPTLEELTPRRYLMKTHYNVNNVFDEDRLINIPELLITKEKRLYSLILQVGVNDMSVGLVQNIADRDDGDIEICIKPMRSAMPLDDEIVKFNLEMMIKEST
jgi:hypothetical protein